MLGVVSLLAATTAFPPDAVLLAEENFFLTDDPNSVADEPDANDRASSATSSRRSSASVAAVLNRQPPNPAEGQPPGPDLLDLPLEQLAQQRVRAPALEQEVTSVSRQVSSVGKSPAAVFVITNDMIRRNGATSIPEALRMAPGINVARIDSNKWAVSARGFSDRFAGTLLVQIDGRVVYNQLTSGVYWDVPDVVLQDVERIEVIRGPGATVWGSNAVNGIINIITKHSKDTQGAMVSAVGGTVDKAITSVRYGGSNDDETLHYRLYGKWFERGKQFLPSGPSQLAPPRVPPGFAPIPITRPNDDWRSGRGGFRVDWDATECDTVMLQGEAYAVSSGRSDFRPQTAAPFVWQNLEDEVSIGGDVLARWQHETGENANWALQVYWDHFGRASGNNNNVNAINVNHPINVNLLNFRADTYDLEFQQQFPLNEWNKFIYGLGYRQVDTFFSDSTGDGGFALGSNPTNRVLNRYAGFLQDEFTLVDDRWYFTPGCKFEHNTLAGFQYQPTCRLLWTPTDRQSAWGAVSRAVRIPNISETAVSITGVPPLNSLPTFVQTRGNQNLKAEDVMAYELGYRAQTTDEFSFDTALFYNVYDNLIVPKAGAVVPGPRGSFLVPAQRVNGLRAETYGIEFLANWKVTDTWRLQGNYSFLQMLVHSDSAATSGRARSIEGASPQHQVYLQSSWDLTETVEFDLMARYVDQLENFPSGVPNKVPSYISMDARLGWRPCAHREFAVVGQNLLDNHHLEFGGNQFLSAPLIEMRRTVYGMFTMTW